MYGTLCLSLFLFLRVCMSVPLGRGREKHFLYVEFKKKLGCGGQEQYQLNEH